MFIPLVPRIVSSAQGATLFCALVLYYELVRTSYFTFQPQDLLLTMYVLVVINLAPLMPTCHSFLQAGRNQATGVVVALTRARQRAYDCY
jgi:hypothetical protein